MFLSLLTYTVHSITLVGLFAVLRLFLCEGGKMVVVVVVVIVMQEEVLIPSLFCFVFVLCVILFVVFTYVFMDVNVVVVVFPLFLSPCFHFFIPTFLPSFLVTLFSWCAKLR